MQHRCTLAQQVFCKNPNRILLEFNSVHALWAIAAVESKSTTSGILMSLVPMPCHVSKERGKECACQAVREHDTTEFLRLTILFHLQCCVLFKISTFMICKA
jgi:hypothetical protein